MNLQRKKQKVYLKQKNEKRSEQWGEEIRGPNHWITPYLRFDTKGGEIVRIPGLQMHVLTLVANTTLLNNIRRNYRTVLRAGIVRMVVNKTKGIEQSTVQRHGKEVGRGGGRGGCFDWSGKWQLVFQHFFIGWMKRCDDPLSYNIRFKMITFIGVWAKCSYFAVLPNFVWCFWGTAITIQYKPD